MTFQEAMRHMLAGHKMRRAVWDAKWTLKIARDESDHDRLDFYNEEFNIHRVAAEDILENDWEMVSES